MIIQHPNCIEHPISKDDAIHHLTVALSAYMGAIGLHGARISRDTAEGLHGLAMNTIKTAQRAK